MKRKQYLNSYILYNIEEEGSRILTPTYTSANEIETLTNAMFFLEYVSYD